MDNKTLKIVITGGPGGGKTTALELFRQELGEKVQVVPEAATILFRGGLPRSKDPFILKNTQKSIYHLQHTLENSYAHLYPEQVLICDRGSLDGAIYWPGEQEAFFEAMGTTLEAELARYDAVIFFETAAASGSEISSNNPCRNESEQEAIEIDRRLRALYSQHPQFHFVGSSESFLRKMMFGVMTIENTLQMHAAEQRNTDSRP